MSELTFLTYEQVFGENRLEIFEKYGTKAAITDFAILLGGTGSWWWTRSFDTDNTVRYIGVDGDRGWIGVSRRHVGARPVIHYSLVQSNSSKEVINSIGIKEIEYGEYPQTIVDESYSCELERAYNSGNISKTGKSYTADSGDYSDWDTSFMARTHTEYEYNGEKYIRFVGDFNCNGELLSDGRTVQAGDIYWVKVEPIVWLVDEKADIALSKKILFSGIQFDNEKNYNGDFENTLIKQFMDDYLSKEIVVEKEKTEADIWLSKVKKFVLK